MKLGNNTNSLDNYENTALGILVAIDKSERKLISSTQKKFKNKAKSGLKVKGYKFIMDEEFKSLKIDFSQEFYFEIMDLVAFK